MDRETTRRAVLGAVLGAGVAGGYLSPARDVLDQFAPLSGSVWDAATASRQDTVGSPHGPATVRYDDDGVPHVRADDEEALYFAVGYTQATDRLFQLDLQRRLYSGELSAVVGDVTVESDRFHRRLAFREAAAVTAEGLDGTRVGTLIDAYADGVNAAIENEPLPVEFALLEYEPEPWTRTDTALVEKIISWQLTGSFRTLRRALARDRLGREAADELYPARYDHDVPIIREQHGDRQFGADLTSPDRDGRTDRVVGQPLVDWLGQFEPSDALGSNSWVLSPDHAPGDAPVLSNDPHLSLQAPPVWYEMHLDGPTHRVRGVTFPGEPFVVIGENDRGAWGFTNAGADVIDFYRYDTDGETYRYGDERREFDVDEQVITVDGGDDETVEVRRSVHGPVIEEAEQEVGVAWTGHAATKSLRAIYNLSHSEGLADALAARFDTPPQNLVYADRDGNTLYRMTGRVPVRTTDGQPVDGDRVFDGSAREGEWPGFEPFAEPTWEGFVPVNETPQVVNPDYLATANQQIVPDDRLGYYLAPSYTNPYRGERIYDLLDERIAADGQVDEDFLRELGRDTYDGRAADLVDPLVAAARDADDDALDEAADVLGEWDYRMDADSRAALLFDRWLDRYREAVFGDAFADADLGGAYYPDDRVLARLPSDSEWFTPRGRDRAMRRALREALADVEAAGHEVYGDLNHTGHITHPLGLDFLGYPSHARGGADQTVWNFDRSGPWGGSWEMHADLDGDLLGILPGGNSGRYFSDHYGDQLRQWANGEYRRLDRSIEGDLRTRFVEGDG
ncbi:MAG: penicillin acylase family protein [Halovenus sp.]